MAKASIKKNDTVFVISGSERGKSGKVLRVDRKANRVYVQGLNMQKKTVRRSQEKPQGGIMDVEGPIHISKVMHEDRYRARRQASPATSEKQS